MCIPPQPTTTTSPNPGINEAILAAVWNEQSPLRGPMWDCEGKPVAVIYRGRWTAGNGPDFQGAMLQIGEGAGLTTGSVEIHLRCADWYAHGHDTDPNYNTVALHVVLWPAGAKPVARADGGSVPTLVLADYITLTSAELLERVTPLVPNLGTLSEEPCWQRTRDWPLDRLLTPIEDAGDARLLAKAAAMDADLDVYASPDEVFYRGLMDSLGYSANREPMRALAAALPLTTLLTLPLGGTQTERAILFESILLGAAGFLPSQRPDLEPLDYLSAAYAEEVEAIWQTHAGALGLQHMPVIDGWTVNRVRPANSPPRRLAAAARLLARLLWEPGSMMGPFLDAYYTLSPTQLAKEWTALLTVPGEGYWDTHADFGRPLGVPTSAALVGKSRAADIVVNILLPLLVAHADRQNLPKLSETAVAVYARYPKLGENTITDAMSEEALGPRKAAIKTARQQQGLIGLYRLYCQARRCYECPVSGVRGER
jgi:hypothetical protein